MTAIVANARTVRQLLAGRKYGIDFFQREYRWESKQIVELVTDLAGRFRASWRTEHRRPDVARYGSYFLGSIIVSATQDRHSVIDGQQRLTSLTLLLIWLLKKVPNAEDQRTLADLIFSRAFGVNAYNLDVPERRAAMDALYHGQPFPRDGQPESVRNILDRFDDIGEAMPPEIEGEVAAMFADWLVEKVTLVEIAAPSDDGGYEVFETMNDRGLPLTPTDMLKSHLLAKAGVATATEAQQDAVDVKRRQLNGLWKGRVDELNSDESGEDADAIKAWLRARHARTIRERTAGAVAGDFDRIGSEFHRWVRDQAEMLGLREAADFARFVERDFSFYTRWYLDLRRLSKVPTPGQEVFYSNGQANFTLQYPLMLAVLEPGEPQEEGWRKVNVVAAFLDILLTRRVWNGMSIDYSTMQYAMFLAMVAIRGQPADAVAAELRRRIADGVPEFASNPRFRMWSTYKKPTRRFLSRISVWVDQQVGVQSSFAAYLSSSGPQGYDIEHVMADHAARYINDFPNPIDFDEYRNRIGGLLMLPKSFNRSYGDLPFEQKRDHYLTQNALAQTFHPKAYERNPGLRRLVDKGFPFEPFDHFGKEEVEKRQTLYTRLAEVIWSPDRLDLEASR